MPEIIEIEDSEVDLSTAVTPFTNDIEQGELLSREERSMQTLQYGAPGVLAGMVDTFGTSLGLLDDDSVEKFLAENTQNFSSYYKQNKEALQTIGDLGGMFIPGMLAVKGIQKGSSLYQAMSKGRKSRLLETVFTSGKTRDQLLAGVRARDRWIARRSTQLTKDFTKDNTRKQLAARARNTRIADAFKETIAFEMGVYATMNDSQTLYPDEFSTMELIAFNAALPAIVTGVEVSMIQRAIRKSAQANSEKVGMQITGVNDVIYRPGARDTGLAIESYAVNDIEQLAATTSAGQALKLENLNRSRMALQESIKKQTKAAGRDKPMSVNTSSTNLSDAQVQNVMEAQSKEPTTILGTMSIENVPNNYNDMVALPRNAEKEIKRLDAALALERGKDLDKIDSAKIQELQTMRDKIASAEYYVLEKDGALVPALERKPVIAEGDAKVRRLPATANEPAMYEMTIQKDPLYNIGSRRFAVTEDGILVVPQADRSRLGGVRTAAQESQTNFETLSLYQRSGVYELYNRMVNDYVPGRTTFNISAADDHARLDAVLELHSRFGDEFVADLRLGDDLTNVDDIEFASLAGKFGEYVRLRNFTERAAANQLIKIGRARQFTQEDMRKMLNLPGTADGSIHPALAVFETFYQQGDTQLRKAVASMEDFRRLMQENDFFPMRTMYTGQQIDTRGSMIAYAPNSPKRAPVMLVKRPLEHGPDRGQLVNEMQNQRSVVMSEMAQSQRRNAGLVQLVHDVLAEQQPTVGVAKQLSTVVEGGQRGRGAFISQEFAAGELGAVLAARQLEGITDRRFRKAVGDLYEQVQPAISPLRDRRNLPDLENFNLFVHARRQGWDLKPGTVDLEGGSLSGFALRNTKFNKDKWRNRFGDEMPENALLPAPTRSGQPYTPLGVSRNALNAIEAISGLGRVTLDNTNQLKRLAGRGPSNVKEWWVPPKNFANTESVFLVNAAGDFQSVVPGRTLRDARAKAQQAISASDDNLFIVEQKDLNRYISLQDRAYEKMVDFGDVLAQTGRARGGSVTEVVDTGQAVLDDMFESLNKQFESILRRSRAVYFEPEIDYARKLYNASGAESARKGQSVWQNYLAAIFGNPTLNPNDNIGRAYYTIESIYDDVLNALYDRIGERTNFAGFQKAFKSKGDEALYNDLKRQLGPHNPFTDTMDFINRRHGLSAPPSMRKHMAALNNITSLLTLRLFEVGHAILTMTSLGATLPGVIKAMKRTEFETPAQHANRIGAFGIKVSDDSAMFSPVRAGVSTMHFLFTKEGRRVWKVAEAEGYFDQSVSEIMRTLTSPHAGYVERLAGKYGKFMTILSDKSEELARGIAFMHGYQIAKRGLNIGDDKLAFAFAHRTANETIGNYSPHNRPRIFQGAVGMPLGLFQTFMWNYYQRVFGYIENAQTKALGWQYFSQAAIFGAQTVPGFQQFVDIFASNYDGTANPVEALERRFGTEAAEWILYGSLSNLPKMFGADDGIALYTRGDVTARNIPTIANLEDTPTFSMLRRTFGAIGKTIDMMRERGFSDQQMAEIVANYSTNRFFRNMAHMYSGTVTDSRGQVIGDTPTFGEIIDGEVQDEMALIARLTGMRTLKESRKVEAFSRIRGTQFAQRARMERLRDAFRADVRGGDLSQERLNEAFANYIRYGGNPENIAAWMGQQFLRGQVDKASLELVRVLNDPTRSYDIQRLVSAMVLPENDPEFQ